MNTLAMVALVFVVGAVTFFYRYAMIGLFAGNRLPGWLHVLCKYIAPASFAALTASALFIDGGAVSIALDTPRPWAALVAAGVAWRSGNVLATIATGMATLYALKFIL